MKRLKSLIFIILFLVLFNIFSIKVRALEDGVYTITSAINENYAIDLTWANAKNESNIELYKYNFTNAQKWQITSLNDGYYVITSMLNNNYAIDLRFANYINGTNIQLYERNNSDAQKWLIKETSDGYYNIASSNNNFVIDVSNGKAFNGSNVQLFQANGTKAQKFRFNKVETGSKVLEDGVYTISSSININKMIDVAQGKTNNDANIQIFDQNGTDAQKWIISYLNNGYYSISSYKNEMFLFNVAYGGMENGTNLEIYEKNSSLKQEWIIKDLGDGYYNIISGYNGLLVDVFNGSVANQNNVWLHQQNGTKAQKFKFNKVDNPGSKTIDDGYYFISSKLNINKLLDINNGNIADDNNVQLYSSNSTIAQKWYIKYVGDGYYEILSNKDNNYSLTYKLINDIYNVQLNSYTNSDNQKWIIKDTYDGYFRIVSKNGMYIDVDCAKIDNGTNIKLYNYNNTNAQKFKFINTANGIGESSVDNGTYILQSALDNNMVVDLSGGKIDNCNNIQLFQTNGTKAQKWQFEYLENGYYKITSLLDLNKSIDVTWAGIKNGTNLQLYGYNGSYAQQWLLKDAGNGYYYIISNCNNLAVNVTGTSNGSNVNLYEQNGSDAQKFKLVKSQEKSYVLDVSAYQGNVDWDKISQSGVYGVILRAGYLDFDGGKEDSKFAQNIAAVKSHGIPYGIYIFSYATSVKDSTDEANFTNSLISKYTLKPSLGIFYDVEDWYVSPNNTSNILTQNDYYNIISNYINIVSGSVQGKYKVKVYASTYYANTRLNDTTRNYVDWIAEWGSKCNYNGRYSIWQFTDSATVSGINGYVDESLLN